VLLKFLRDPTAQPSSQPAFAHRAYRQLRAERTALLQHSDKPQEPKRGQQSHHKMLPFPILSTLYVFFFSYPLKVQLLQLFCLVLKSHSHKGLNLCIPHFCQKQLQELNSSRGVSLDILLLSHVLTDSLLQSVKLNLTI